MKSSRLDGSIPHCPPPSAPTILTYLDLQAGDLPENPTFEPVVSARRGGLLGPTGICQP